MMKYPNSTNQAQKSCRGYEKDTVNLTDYLNTTQECLQVQTMCIVKQIFVDEKAGKYFKSTDKFINQNGFPCEISFTGSMKLTVKLFSDIILSLRFEVVKIVKEFNIANIKVINEK